MNSITGLNYGLPRILIADDQPDVLVALRLLLKGNGYATETVSSPAELLEALAQSEFDLVLMDLNYARDTTSGQEGLDLLSHLKAIERMPPIVVMTGWATVGLAVEAMQRGVRDFVEKPWTNSKLLDILKNRPKGREKSRTENAARWKEAARRRNCVAVPTAANGSGRGARDSGGISCRRKFHSLPDTKSRRMAAGARVGGDYFDVLSFDGGSLGLCIADVAGKGMPAALLMSNLQAGGAGCFAVMCRSACEKLNVLVCRNIRRDRFITFFYAQLDGRRAASLRECGSQRTGCAASRWFARAARCGRRRAGHFPTAILRSGEDRSSRPATASCFITDGVTEARERGLEFGDTRLLEVLQDSVMRTHRITQEKIFSASERILRRHLGR